MNNLSLRQATILKNDHALFEPIDLEIRAGEPVILIGPSGIGKSSLLAWIAGLLPPPLKGQGHVVLNGKEMMAIPAHRRKIGLLFQDGLLFPHLSVQGNLAFGLAPGLPRTAITEALRVAGLQGFEHRNPASLSGGERARIALMRCLLSAPQALLLDEPFSELDPGHRIHMRSFLLDQAKNLPLLIVSHDPRDADDGRKIELIPCVSE